MARKKPEVTITLTEDTLRWVDDLVKNDIHFSDRSHVVQVALTEMRDKIGKTASNKMRTQ